MSLPDPLPASPAPSATPSPAAAAVPPPKADPAAAMAALGNPLRWQIFKLMADGTPRCSSDVAAAVKRDFDIVNKHLKLMRDAGWLTWQSGEDRRCIFFSIPAANRAVAGVLDYGWCQLNLARTA